MYRNYKNGPHNQAILIKISVQIKFHEQYPKSFLANTAGGFPSNKQKIGGIISVSCPPYAFQQNGSNTKSP